ncbi:MAG: hypothetical protein F6K17_13015 [Okeania sp. SIO3C4]|nr:hypothetical protein [Okeania sp. SIO3B3]NER03464.1 hypothetical protein [Okeania sp. SIO3C4]
MAIEQDKQEIKDNPVLEDGLSTEGIDPEFLSDLQESQTEFESWLENIRGRREKSVSLLEEVREELEHLRSSPQESQSGLEILKE